MADDRKEMVAKGPQAVTQESHAAKAETAAVEALKETVLTALDDMKANDVVCMDVTGLTPLMDYMVIASGTSSRHVKSLVDSVIEKSKAAGNRPMGVEGLELSEWVLIDLGDMVVHVMLPKAREFYDLERLWEPVPSETEDQPNQ